MESTARKFGRQRKQSKKGSSTSKSKSLHELSPSKGIDQAINRLKEHWVHDVAELFSDCSEAARQLEALLRELKKPSRKSPWKKAELGSKIKDLVMFLEGWEALGAKQLTEQLVCPDELEFHLRCIRTYREKVAAAEEH